MRKYLVAFLAALLIGPGALVAASVSSSMTASVAAAEENGVGARPRMGWSSWGPDGPQASAAKDEQAARDLVRTGLARLGYDDVNQGDFWYVCPGQATRAQDAGMFVTSEAKGSPGTVDFNDFGVTAGATTP